MMKALTINRFNIEMISMFLVFGFSATPTLASEESIHWNLDSMFGHPETSILEDEQDSEWPTEEQPVFVNC